ncbi:hypothetical protein AVEN_205024-1 [Araneus ventricosus]|uniref:Uncharacterized protein n=2 Tax=Araneus ventricosus TaxID=182803 RepID=A0A4Y2LAE0_ARAVE|nr:hypothetical protein AVEN_205024-1 [Araneus ventricosus]
MCKFCLDFVFKTFSCHCGRFSHFGPCSTGNAVRVLLVILHLLIENDVRVTVFIENGFFGVSRKFISIANACRVVPSNWPKKEKGEWLLRRILNHLSESCTAERGLRQGDSLTCLQQTKQLRSRTLNVDVQRALETFERKGKENYIRACTRTRVLANQI